MKSQQISSFRKQLSSVYDVFKKYGFLQTCEFCKILSRLDFKESLNKFRLAIGNSDGVSDELFNKTIDVLRVLNTPPNTIKVFKDFVQLNYFNPYSQSYFLLNVLLNGFKLHRYDSLQTSPHIFIANDITDLNQYLDDFFKNL